MITLSDTATSLVASGQFVYHVSASSWLGGTLLADNIPIASGREETDRSLAVPDRVTLTVPKLADGIDWTPRTAVSPLAAKGQRLKINLGVGIGTGGIEWFQRGVFVIIDSRETEKTIEVQAAGLLTLIDEAKFAAPFQPSGTFVSTLRKLLEPALTVSVLSAPTDRAVPTSAVNWDSDRLGAVQELLDAWPADAFMNAAGYLEVRPDTVPTTPDVVLSDDASSGLVIDASGGSTRDGGFNVVVATGYSSDGGEVRGLAYVDSGPWQYAVGAANPLPVPFTYSSPLLTTNAQCAAAARTVLRRKMRAAVLTEFTVRIPPDPRLQIGDCVGLWADGVWTVCTLEHLTLPYTPDEMTVRLVSTS